MEQKTFNQEVLREFFENPGCPIPIKETFNKFMDGKSSLKELIYFNTNYTYNHYLNQYGYHIKPTYPAELKILESKKSLSRQEIERAKYLTRDYADQIDRVYSMNYADLFHLKEYKKVFEESKEIEKVERIDSIIQEYLMNGFDIPLKPNFVLRQAY